MAGIGFLEEKDMNDILVEDRASPSLKRKHIVEAEVLRGGAEMNSAEGLSLCKGEQAKRMGNILRMRMVNRKRQPNINCRVEAFGRICMEFDALRKGWVLEMGFGGLLHIVGMTLPRSLCYWLMTRVDPIKQTIMLNDQSECALTCNQVRWVLGLPTGGKVVPRKIVNAQMNNKVVEIHSKYGCEVKGKIKKSGKIICSKALMVSDAVLERLKGVWDEEDEEEFKVLFLLVSLYMILCPTQSRSLERDLEPALTCASSAPEYDWCSLVVEKLMASVKRFRKKFDVMGFAGGCGGCSLFVAIYYLDRLNRKPVRWGIWPRVAVWNADEMRRGSREDRRCCGGDFGKLENIRCSYGEVHPFDGGDHNAPSDDTINGSASFTYATHPFKSRGRKACGRSMIST